MNEKVLKTGNRMQVAREIVVEAEDGTRYSFYQAEGQPNAQLFIEHKSATNTAYTSVNATVYPETLEVNRGYPLGMSLEEQDSHIATAKRLFLEEFEDASAFAKLPFVPMFYDPFGNHITEDEATGN